MRAPCLSTVWHHPAPCWSLVTQDHSEHIPLSLLAACLCLCDAEEGLSHQHSPTLRVSAQIALLTAGWAWSHVFLLPLSGGSRPASLHGCPSAAACSAFFLSAGARQQAQARASSLASGQPRVCWAQLEPKGHPQEQLRGLSSAEPGAEHLESCHWAPHPSGCMFLGNTTWEKLREHGQRWCSVSNVSYGSS